MRRLVIWSAPLVLVALATTGCIATRDWVNENLGKRQVQIDDARDAAVPDRDLLIPLRLPDLKREVDQRRQDCKAADEASQRRKIGK